jgi:hypothetical protein
MSLANHFRSDRRLLLLVLNAILAVVLGFFSLSAEMSLQLVTYGGYWAMLVITLCFGWVFVQIVREAKWRVSKPSRSQLQIAGLLAGCGILLLVQESYGFKILMDEIMLLGTSMSMHFDKTAVVPMRGHDLQGAFQLLAGELDKRPLLHPFLVSVLHDLTGYRPENVFVLNTALTFILLGLIYAVARRLAGRGAGIVAVLLLTGLPLLAQNATGGGFELLNAVLILGTLLLSINFVEQRTPTALSGMVAGAILLANTRYESVIFLIPVALLILWTWWQERRVILSWVLVFSPLMMVPYALHHKVFTVRESAWELAGQPGHSKVFSLDYVADNFLHWLNFFFSTDGEHSNSLVLSILGFLAVPFFLLLLVKNLPKLRTLAPAWQAWLVCSLGFLAHTALYLCYFWGKFDDPVIRRLSLPLHLFFVLAIVSVAYELAKGRRIWPVLGVVAGAGLCAFSLPAMARHSYTLEYYVGREMEWRREFIKAHPERDYLFIDNNSIIWITHLVSGTPVLQALKHKENIVFNLRNHTFTAIYVFQRYNVDPATGRQTVEPEDDLGPDYQLETYWERRFTALTVSRISRVVSVREGPTAQPVAQRVSLDKKSPEEREKIRQKFFEEFIKHLP